MTNILNELNLDNGTNYKINTLKKYSNNEDLKRLLKMTYDKVAFTYGVTMKNVPEVKLYSGKNSLTYALTVLEKDLATRNVTGNAAIDLVYRTLCSLSSENAKIIEKVLDRDLKINMGRTNINKVFKNLIIKPPYERCDIGTEKNLKALNFSDGVYAQVKIDGTYRSSTVDNENVIIMSRTGNEDVFPIIERDIKTFNISGYTLIGEMTLRGEKDRKKGNGLINSDNPPHNDIIYTVWDMIPNQEYSMTKDQIKVSSKKGLLQRYEDRFEILKTLPFTDNVRLIEYKILDNITDVYKYFQEVTKRGDEGIIAKSKNLTWKDGTSKEQLKIKLQFEVDVRITGFVEGKKGTKREETFGSITYSTDDGKLQGSVSGFTDKELEDFNSRRDELIGKVMEVEANDITQARGSETYALSHPRFIKLRDKDQTDTIKRAMKSLENSMTLKI